LFAPVPSLLTLTHSVTPGGCASAIPGLSRLTIKSANSNAGIAEQRSAAEQVTYFRLLIRICFFIIIWFGTLRVRVSHSGETRVGLINA
jgi:hypothetical protein